MKIAIIGSGYVGLVAGACFAEMGNEVVVVDIDREKITKLQNAIVPIYEPGLEELIAKNTRLGNITFSTDKESAYSNADFIFIAVGTPMGEDGSADLSYVLAAAKDTASYIQSYTIIVDKSTVPVGSAQKVRQTIISHLKHKNATFDVVSNPEFLKEGVAIKDFMSPDRIIIGSDSPKALKYMRNLYSPFVLKSNRIITMSLESAEMTKYAANAMLATKISFINEISRICEKVGANINDVRIGIGSDSRIGYSFIYPGCGYGGSCFPKDIKALRKTFSEHSISSPLLDAVENVNEAQKRIIAHKILQRFGSDLSTYTFAIWGLAFKPETDDIREASSIEVIKILLDSGAKIRAYDPKAMPNMKNIFPNVEYCDSKYEALKYANALILLTEWKEFRTPDFHVLKKELLNQIIFDGRNVYKDAEIDDFEYYFIGGCNELAKAVLKEKCE